MLWGRTPQNSPTSGIVVDSDHAIITLVFTVFKYLIHWWMPGWNEVREIFNTKAKTMLTPGLYYSTPVTPQIQNFRTFT